VCVCVCVCVCVRARMSVSGGWGGDVLVFWEGGRVAAHLIVTGRRFDAAEGVGRKDVDVAGADGGQHALVQQRPGVRRPHHRFGQYVAFVYRRHCTANPTSISMVKRPFFNLNK
jgi:hypothetical protein